MNKNYYGTEFYGTEKWEEQKKRNPCRNARKI